MSRQRTILRNTVSNIGMQVVSAGLPFLLLPYLLRYWGSETYGILVLAYSVQTFMYFLNSAINMTLMKYVSEFHGIGDHDRLNSVVNLLWVVSFANNLVVSLLLAATGVMAVEWLNVPPDLVELARNVFLVMGACGVVAGAFSFVDGVMYGLQRIHQANVFRVGESLLMALAALATIRLGGTLVQYVLAVGSIPVASRGAQVLLLHRALPRLRFDIRRSFDLREVKRLGKFSGYLVINQLADLLLYNINKLIVQKLMGPASLTTFEIASKPNLLFQNFVSLPLSAILPACSAAYAKGEHAFLEKMLVAGTRIYLVAVLPLIIAFIALMEPFLTVWLGNGYRAAVPAAQLFLWALAIGCPFKVFSHMMVGKGRVFEYVAAKSIYAVIGVPLSVAFVSMFGLIGGVMVTFIYWLFVDVPINLYVMNREGIAAMPLLRQMLPVFAAVAVEYAVLSGGAMQSSHWDWFRLGAWMCSGAAATVLLSTLFVLRRDERRLVGLRF